MFSSLRVGLFMALRTLRRGQKGLIITPILVLCVTYINLLFIPGIIRGAIVANQQKLRQTLVADYAIRPTVKENNIQGVTTKLAAIKKLDGVEAVTSVLQIGNRIRVADAGAYWTVYAIDPTSYTAVFQDNITDGSFLNGDKQPGIVLGSRIAGVEDTSPLGTVRLNDTVKVLTYSKGERSFPVTGIFSDNFYDANIRAFIDSAAFEKINPGSSTQASAIFIKARDRTLPPNSLKQLGSIVPGAAITSTDQTSSDFEQQTNAYKDIGQVIGLMAIIVASIVVFIVTYIDLVQRRRLIGIQRAIGIRGTAVMTAYLLQAVLTTIVGTLLGATVYKYGIVTYFNNHPLSLRNGQVTLVTENQQYIRYALFLLAVSLASAYLPTLRELRRKLLDAIWGTK